MPGFHIVVKYDGSWNVKVHDRFLSSNASYFISVTCLPSISLGINGLNLQVSEALTVNQSILIVQSSFIVVL